MRKLLPAAFYAGPPVLKPGVVGGYRPKAEAGRSEKQTFNTCLKPSGCVSDRVGWKALLSVCSMDSRLGFYLSPQFGCTRAFRLIRRAG